MSVDAIKTSNATPDGTSPRFSLGISFWTATALLLALSVYLAFVPLFDLLGYEFCVAISFLVSTTSGPVAIAALRRGNLLQQATSNLVKVARIYLRAIALNLITLVLPLTVILLNTFRVQNCNIPEGVVFFVLLPVFTTLVCSGWGVATGLLVSGRIFGGLAYASLWLLVALYNILEFWVGPHMDSYNQLTGWIAGPIYDEVVEPGAPLLFSRLFGLLTAWTLVALVCMLWNYKRSKQKSQNRAKWSELAVACVLGLGTLILWVSNDWLGFSRSTDAVESFLSQSITSKHFVLHHHPSLSKEKARLLIRDHEFRFHQIEAQLGRLELPVIHSYIFPNPAAKKRLLGAERVQYAKPWRFSLFLHGDEFPHPTLKHELVHVMAAAFGSWPFRTSADWGLWQNVALIEGLAVAVEWPIAKFDPHLWSAAQRRIKNAPNLITLFDPLSFWSSSARGSYTLSGSFVRFLLDIYGIEPFRQAYRSGTLQGVYPKDLPELVSDYESFLDSILVEPAVENLAKERFSKPSIFMRACAHEMAALRRRANRSMGADRTKQAQSLIRQGLAHLPGDPDLLIGLAQLHMNQNQPEESKRIVEQLLDRDDLHAAQKARIHGMLADVNVLLENHNRAKEHYRILLDAHLDDPTDRTVMIKLQALDQGALGKHVLTMLRRNTTPNAARLLDLRELLGKQPGFGGAWYLLGRMLFHHGHYKQAADYLQRAGRQGLATQALACENLRLLANSLYFLGKTEQAGLVFAVLVQTPRNQEDLYWALDWLERIGFEASS